MSVRSQLRSWVSWPTEALLVGPNTSSPQRWGAWLGSFLLGLGIGAASCHNIGIGIFTLGHNANPFEVTAVVAAASFLPLVFVGLLLPRIAGPMLVLASLAIAVCALPGSQFDLMSALVAVLFALPMCAVGVGFTWSGLRPEAARSGGSGGVA